LVDLAKGKEDSADSSTGFRDKAQSATRPGKIEELREYAGKYESERNLSLVLKLLTDTNYQHLFDRGFAKEDLFFAKIAVGSISWTAKRNYEYASAGCKLGRNQSMDVEEKNTKRELVVERKRERQSDELIAMRVFF